MSITLQHLQGFVPGDGRHLHRVQALLKEAAGGLVTEVVEGQPSDAGTAAGSYIGLMYPLVVNQRAKVNRCR